MEPYWLDTSVWLARLKELASWEQNEARSSDAIYRCPISAPYYYLVHYYSSLPIQPIQEESFYLAQTRNPV